MLAPHRQYDADVAHSYDEDRESEAHWQIEQDFINHYFSAQTPTRLLDAPVGTGRFLPSYVAIAEVHGIDQSPEMLDMARQRARELAKENLRLDQADIFQLPFPDRHFDVAVCWRFAHLIPADQLTKVLRELGRVTDGDILLQAYVEGRYMSRLAWKIFGFPERWLRRLRSSNGAQRPWSHIRAYFHPLSTFDVAIAAAGLKRLKLQTLCPYQGHEVCVMILGRA